MSEIKFACPNCQQNIEATSEYSGLQINCPSCQTLLVVPAATDAPAPQGARLSKTPTSGHSQPGAAAAAAATFYSARPVAKKKSKNGLIVGLSLGACAAAAVIYFGPTTLMEKFSHEIHPAAAADLTPTNAPPPPPPELTTEEVLQKVGDTYQGLTDYVAKAETVCDIDASALDPRKGKINLTTTSSLQLGRTNNYRLEWEQKLSGKSVKGAAWSAGKGDFVGYGSNPPNKVKTRQIAMASSAAFFVLSSGIAELFFSDTNSVAAQSQNFTKTNGPGLNGQDCYVLTGEQNHQNLLIWVNKSTFLVSQLEIILGEKIDDAELKKIPSTQRNAMIAMSKLQGTIIETYSGIQTNQNLQASAFESSYRPTANASARSQRPSSKAGQLANPDGRRQRPQ
jgi:hypothetical protein